jgi:predicted RND superfamily exporter protein
MAFLTLSPEHYFSKIMQSDKWNRKLKQAFIFSIRNGKKLLFGSAVLFVVSWIGIRQLEQKNKLFEELPDNSPLLTEINYFNEHFVGTRPFEMALELRHDSSFFDYDLLLKMDALDDYLIHEYGVEYLISPSMVVKKINLDIHNGDTAYFNLPEKEEVDRIARFFTKKRFEREMSAFIDNTDGMARISARVHDFGSDYFKDQNAELATFFREEGLNEYFDYTLTGSANMIDRSNEVLAEKLIWGLLAAFAMIAILLGAIFQSFKMIAVVLFINIIPLFGVAGLMGFLGVDLKISTSVIFTIAFGIAVDDTIHFLSKYRLARQHNISLVFALKNTYLSTGRAIILTSFVLIGGFISLLLSDFKGTYYIGLLVSGTLVMALLTDLLILPFLLYIVKGKDGKF